MLTRLLLNWEWYIALNANHLYLNVFERREEEKHTSFVVNLWSLSLTNHLRLLFCFCVCVCVCVCRCLQNDQIPRIACAQSIYSFSCLRIDTNNSIINNNIIIAFVIWRRSSMKKRREDEREKVISCVCKYHCVVVHTKNKQKRNREKLQKRKRRE